MTYLLPIFAFLLGSIPFGLFIARAHGVNIREQGSGNIGATNVLRTIGKKAGYSCLFLDLLKGFIPVLIATNLFRWEGARDPQMHLAFLDGARAFLSQFHAQLLHVICGLLAVLGHNYSPWIGFKGGKGIATSGGVLLALAPAAVILLLLLWIVLFFATRYVSVASIGSALALPLITHWGARFHHVDGDKSQPTLWEAGQWNKPLFFLTLILALLAVWKHRANIVKLINGTENRFERKKKNPSAPTQ